MAYGVLVISVSTDYGSKRPSASAAALLSGCIFNNALKLEIALGLSPNARCARASFR
jgi:hypothetical protein